MPYTACPKCGQRPPQPLGDTDACPACGVYLHKWRAMQQGAMPEAIPAIRAVAANDAEAAHGLRWLSLADAEPLHLAARAGLLALLGVWGLYLAQLDIADGEIGNSFMHRVLLVFHEAGHVFFIPLGEFWTIAGGSLFQVLLPLGIGLAFLLKNRDPYGAALCLWWSGISLIDLAPYIYDALQPQLILLTGTTGEDGPHDWIYLLGRFHAVRQAHGLGRLAQWSGILVAQAALAWAAVALWLTFRKAHRD